MQLYVDYLVKVLHFRRVNNPSDVPVKSCNYLASKPLKSHNFLHLCGQIFFYLVVSQSLLVSCSAQRSQTCVRAE